MTRPALKTLYFAIYRLPTDPISYPLPNPIKKFFEEFFFYAFIFLGIFFLPTNPAWKFWVSKQQTNIFLRLASAFLFLTIFYSGERSWLLIMYILGHNNTNFIHFFSLVPKLRIAKNIFFFFQVFPFWVSQSTCERSSQPFQKVQTMSCTNEMSHMTKPTKWLCIQQRLR